MHDKSHTVERLAVHLERKQRVFFEVGSEREALSKAGETALTAWFRLNGQTEEWRHLRYAEMPTYFTWSKPAREWKKRVRQGPAERVIGRLHGAQPSEGNRFFLYLLLLHVTGAQSYEDLLTVDGVLYESFREAAVALGLANSDEEYAHALEEAVQCRSPSRLRHLFAYMLLHCELAKPLDLWVQFRDEFAADYLHRGGRQDLAFDAALTDVQTVLAQSGKTLEDYDLPLPTDFDWRAFHNKDLNRERDYDCADERASADTMHAQMYPAQAAAYAAVLADVSSGASSCCFVDGPGGAG